MFAKLICESNSTESFASAVDRSLRSLDEFHIAGLPTNLRQLRGILSHPILRASDARTTFLAEHIDLITSNGALNSSSGSLALLSNRRRRSNSEERCTRFSGAQPGAPGLAVPDGEEGVPSPMAGTVIELSVEIGATVHAGATLMVISAMKMESAITAPCAGVITAIRPTGDQRDRRGGADRRDDRSSTACQRRRGRAARIWRRYLGAEAR